MCVLRIWITSKNHTVTLAYHFKITGCFIYRQNIYGCSSRCKTKKMYILPTQCLCRPTFGVILTVNIEYLPTQQWMLVSVMDTTRAVFVLRYELKFHVEYDEIFRSFKHVTLSPNRTSVVVPYYTWPAFSKTVPILRFSNSLIWNVIFCGMWCLIIS